MTLEHYEKLPDWYPKKEEKIKAINSVISILTDFGFTRAEAYEVLEGVKSELASYTAKTTIGDLAKLKSTSVNNGG